MPQVFIATTLITLAGIFIALQAPINNRLGDYMGGPLVAAFISFVIGTLALSLVLLVLQKPVMISAIPQTSLWMWTGGLLGAFLVATSIYAVPVLGVGLLVALLITGQLISSIVMDHYGFLVPEIRSITPGRVLGAAMLIGGAVLIKYY